MTHFYLDTEFNGHGGELISMAIVSPTGFAWHSAKEVVAQIDPWVSKNVMPKLTCRQLSHDAFRRSFLEGFIYKVENPKIFCDWHADAAHFLHLLSGADYQSSIDFPCEITILKTPPGYPVSKNPHNAYDDAVALMQWHMAVEIAPGILTQAGSLA